MTEPTEITAGFHDVEITAVGHPNVSLPTPHLHFPSGASTLVQFSSGEHAFVFPDETETLAGSARLRVWHFVQTLQDTDVVEDGTTLVSQTDLFFPTAYFELSAGGHTLRMFSAQKDKVLFSFHVSAEAATNYTAFIWDVNGELQVLVVVDAESVPDTALATHMSTPSPPPVGALLGGLLAVTVLTHRLMGRMAARS